MIEAYNLLSPIFSNFTTTNVLTASFHLIIEATFLIKKIKESEAYPMWDLILVIAFLITWNLLIVPILLNIALRNTSLAT